MYLLRFCLSRPQLIEYQNLGAVIDQAVAALSSNYATLSECTTRLQVLKRILEDYLSHQI